MSKAFIAGWRLGLLVFAVLLSFAGIFSRLFYLHVWERDNLVKIVEQNREKLEVKYARRGNIVDARGNLLAATRSVIELGIDPQVYNPEDASKLPLLANYAGIDLGDLEKLIEHKSYQVQDGYKQEVRLIRWHKIADSIDENVYEKIKALGIDGVYGNRKYQRIYPGGPLASHVIGFVNKENTSVLGIEKYMDFYLRGQDGWYETEKDGRRRELAQFRSRDVEPVDGLGVETTIDLVIQDMVEVEVARIVQEYEPNSATIIVSEPSTGYILGLANYPTFDPNNFWKYPIDSLRNRAVSDIFEPGSVFKIVAASGALEEKLVDTESVLDCSLPTVNYRGRLVRLPRDDHPLGRLTVHEVVTKSSNRGAAQLGMLLGERRLYEYAHAFGFGEDSGFGLGGEVDGILHPVKDWDGLTISRLPMGHAVSATPMQVHYAMSVVSNEGVLMTPRLVRRVFDKTGSTVVSFGPKARHRVISVETARTMASLLADVTRTGGTATRASIPGFEVAGKTGTTQKIIDGRYSNRHHVATFSGFFPASHPRLVITVVVNDPQLQGTGYGGTVSAPAFRNIAEKLIQYLAIRPPVQNQEILAWEGGNY